MAIVLENSPLVRLLALQNYAETCCKTKRCLAYTLPLAIRIPNLQAPIGMPKFTSMSSLLAAPSKWMASPSCVTANLQFSEPVEQACSISKKSQTLHVKFHGVSGSLPH